jgi:hypothetical protein
LAEQEWESTQAAVLQQQQHQARAAVAAAELLVPFKFLQAAAEGVADI